MDIKELIDREDRKSKEEKYIKKIQQKVISLYQDLEAVENNIELDLGLLNKCKDEIDVYLTTSGLSKTGRYSNGSITFSPNTYVYNYRKTDIEVLFNNYSSTEVQIYITVIENQSNGDNDTLKYNCEYKLTEESESMISRPEILELGGEPLLYDDYETKIKSCNSDNELNDLENKINKNIEHIKNGLKCISKFKQIYIFKGDEFGTFKELFETL